jgi:hypothetical protein
MPRSRVPVSHCFQTILFSERRLLNDARFKTTLMKTKLLQKFRVDATSACKRRLIVISCLPIMEMEQ